ncbi:helix-turn-helix transcriptional regulator [Rhodococcus chondri]|uniref:LuxR C-terminal-related transcriptional regulator n=1 Tax=Rhodococcus chondri TaxID=3065941 RepID=A0ABU7JLR1_9NOCA|nr:LuxR C-terminal-related transcriptional regulator [Rhodococcus sp. CC-R104]MEE2030980.1 LuxR C-terminal-related transcriptional regulator [Rhodococcus sp. CC-R104]
MSAVTAVDRTCLLRPSDVDALRAELRALRSSTDLPVLFGGTVHGPDLVLSGFVGTRSRVLRNLVISSERGLGGRVIAEQRPGAVADYFHSAHITHDYDREVAGEGIESLLAVPVVVGGRTRAALYGGLRAGLPIGDVVAERVMRAARALAREIEIRDEVDRRVQLLETARDTECSAAPLPAAVSEVITESFLKIREIASRTSDPTALMQLGEVEAALRTVAGRPSTSGVHLTEREREVLAYVALGCRNAEIGDRLGLTVQTVKSYLKHLMAKLEVRSRHEAVVEARRQGLLP